MVTCWIALDPCGVVAPGLELVTCRISELIAPVDLAPDRVDARYHPGEFWRPRLLPGDALVFHGDILHRTHVTPSMAQDRTSIELRFLPAKDLPARLAGDHFLQLAVT
jgi:ectoine hydroxylase-related dioxygenase (phytanoyl-CoA dioxygenase family)